MGSDAERPVCVANFTEDTRVEAHQLISVFTPNPIIVDGDKDCDSATYSVDSAFALFKGRVRFENLAIGVVDFPPGCRLSDEFFNAYRFFFIIQRRRLSSIESNSRIL